MPGPDRTVRTTPTRKRDPLKNNPPRPPNAWILFRSDEFKKILEEMKRDPTQKRMPQADISKLIAARWKTISDDERQEYEKLSERKKVEHMELYPGYRFQP
ncbi:hypothetical protein M422DRAFT_195883, partial [Sphaerobolus stellatus SS14]